MSRATAELTHMLRYLEESEISFRAWKDYFEEKARILANWQPDEYSQLPMMLSAELRRIESKHLPLKPPKKGSR